MNELPRDRLDVDAMYQRFAAEGARWGRAKPLVFGGVEAADTWEFPGIGMRIFVSIDPNTEPGTDWVHASVAYKDPTRMPSYNDLKRMHRGVFGDGHAYQVFAPAAEHVNIRSNALHIWGRLDGLPVLPNFGRLGTI
jgi:hypothetical protein